MFCREDESIIHLFFECSMAKYVWSMVAMVVGGDCRPSSFDQFWYWVAIWWDWPGFAGHFGELEIMCALKRKR